MSTIKSFHNVWAENPKSNRLRTISYPKIGTYCEDTENIYHEKNKKTKIIEGRVSLYTLTWKISLLCGYSSLTVFRVKTP